MSVVFDRGTNTDKVTFLGKMVAGMKETLSMKTWKEQASTDGLMEPSTKENGKTERCMEQELSNLEMADTTKVVS